MPLSLPPLLVHLNKNDYGNIFLFSSLSVLLLPQLGLRLSSSFFESVTVAFVCVCVVCAIIKMQVHLTLWIFFLSFHHFLPKWLMFRNICSKFYVFHTLLTKMTFGASYCIGVCVSARTLHTFDSLEGTLTHLKRNKLGLVSQRERRVDEWIKKSGQKKNCM